MNELRTQSKSGLHVFVCPFCGKDEITADSVGYHIVEEHTPELLRAIKAMREQE